MDHDGHDRLEFAPLIRLLYRVALPVGSAVAAASWLLLRPASGSEVLPALALLLLLLTALHAFSDLPHRTLHTLLLIGVGGFLLLDAASALLGFADPASLARTAPWFPLLSALPVLLYGRALGRWLALLPSAALLLLWLVGLPGGFDGVTVALLLQVTAASVLAALLLDRATASPPAAAAIDIFATDDALTGLLDASTLMARLEREARDPGTRFAAILLEIDSFAYLSGEIGPDGTEGVQRAVADFLESGVREAETVSHWTEGSFLVFVARTDAPEATTLAERLRRGMMRVPVSGLPRLTVSIGVAVRNRGEAVDSLIGRAEQALAMAKRSGGDQVMLDAGGGEE